MISFCKLNLCEYEERKISPSCQYADYDISNCLMNYRPMVCYAHGQAVQMQWLGFCQEMGLLRQILRTYMLALRSEWQLSHHGWITYRLYRQPKLLNFLSSSNRLHGGGASNAGNATLTFCLCVLAKSKPATLTVESLWTAPTETAKHLILVIDEAS